MDARAMALKSRLRGWFGETMTSFMNWAFLDKSVYRQLNNITLELLDSSTTQIDHLIVSVYGIFVLETKHMSGWIFGDEKDALWTQSFPNGKKFKFQNPIRQNYRHMVSLIEFLSACESSLEIDRSDIEKRFFSVVFFGPDAVIKTSAKLPDSVNRGPLAYVKSKTDQVFTAEQIEAIFDLVKAGQLPKGILMNRETNNRHIRSLRERHDRKEGDNCPRCGKQLVARKRKKDGQAFIGCSGFPNCRFVKD
jgi:hypothetical protein